MSGRGEGQLDLRPVPGAERGARLFEALGAVCSGDRLWVDGDGEPERLYMALLESGYKFSLAERATDRWRLRVDGADYHPQGMGVGLHSLVVDPAAPWLVACDRRDALFAIDSAHGSVGLRVNVGGAPSHVAMHPQGTSVAVANFAQGSVLHVHLDDLLAAGLPADGADATSAALPGPGVVHSLPIGCGPHLPAFSADGRFVCATGTVSGDVAVIDVEGERVVDVLPVGHEPHDPIFSPDGERVFVAVSGQSEVAVVALPPRGRSGRRGRPKVAGRIAVGRGPSHLAWTPDGARLVVANAYDASVSVLCADATEACGYRLEGRVAAGRGAHVPEVTADGALLVVANFLDDTLSLIELATGRTRATVPVGPYPHSFGLSPDGRLAVVACWGGEESYIVSLADGRVAGTVPTGPGSSHVAFSPSGAVAYVTSSLADTISVVDLAQQRVIRTVMGGRPLPPRKAACGPA